MKTTNIFLFLVILILFSLAVGRVDAQQTYYLWWDSLYTGPGLAQDSAVAMVMDNAGNIYVTGWSVGSGTSADIVTIKYNPSNGSRVWVNRFNYANLVDRPKAIAVDNASGFVYVTGLSYKPGGPFDRDFVTIKYNSTNGDTVWTRRYNGPVSGGDESNAIAIDNSGNIFVTGFSDQGSTGTSLDIVTIKYAPDGAATSINVLEMSNIQRPNAIKIDNSGNVIVVGNTTPVSTSDYITVKYNNSLVQQWIKTYNGTANNLDDAIGVVTDASGNIYVTGYSYWTGQLLNYVTIKYNSNGDSLSGASYNWTFNNSEVASAIGMDANGNIFVTGYSVTAVSPSTVYDYATVKYNSSLTEQWVRRYNGTGNGLDRPTALAIDVLNNVYVTGLSVGAALFFDYLTLKYDNNGNAMDTVRLSGNTNEFAAAISVTDSNIFITGSAVHSGTGLDFYTVRFSLRPVGVTPISSEVPTKFGLYQNYPNPFNPSTTIRFDLAKTSDVKIIIYDLTGRQVDLITEKGLRAGKYELDWDAGNLASGVYLYTLIAGDYFESRKMMLVK